MTPTPPPSPSAEDVPSRAERFLVLCDIIARLRAPDGCPWDREQTHASLRKYLLEEAYEALDAIEDGDPAHLRDELGDVLLQIMLHSQIAEEAGAFDIGDVISGLSEKMVRRHPHVFGDVSVAGSDDVIRNWADIKAAERSGAAPPASALDGIPRELPALMKAMEVSKRAVKRGFEWERLEDVWAKVREEIDELEVATRAGDADAVRDEMGDLFFSLVNVSRWLKVDPEEALRRMMNRFGYRFRYMEARLAETGRTMEETPLTDLEQLWNEAKAAALTD